MDTPPNVIEFSEENKNGILIIRFKGRLDVLSTPSIEKKIFKDIDGGHHKIILNLNGISYISSAAIKMMLATIMKLRPVAGGLIICSAPETVLHILQASGFLKTLKLVKSEEEAIKILENKGDA